MSFKDILVIVDGSARAGARLDVAMTLARRHQAHLVALNIRGRDASSAMLAAQFGSDMEMILARNDEAAAIRAKALVDERSAAMGLAVEWRDVTGEPVATAALHARYSDLVVVGQTSPDEAEGGLADELALSVGRPMLVIPHSGRFVSAGQRILVAWNASREATRAVHDAMPLLVEAETVLVAAINPEHGIGGHGDIPGADICLHLSRHGVTASCEHLRADDVSVGAMLLNRAADEDCDMLVMGAWGRSRLREMVLGGATRHVFEHMTIPVLLSH